MRVILAPCERIISFSAHSSRCSGGNSFGAGGIKMGILRQVRMTIEFVLILHSSRVSNGLESSLPAR